MKSFLTDAMRKMFHRVPSIVLLTLHLAFVVQALNISNNTLEPTRKGLNISVEPPLTDFINATELGLMQKLVPQEEIEWINATLNSPWTSNNMIQEGNRRTRNLHRKLLRRYVDVTRCPDLRRRVVMRNELHAIMQMILDAIRNMTLSHPVWRALISPAFREEPRALERMKGLLQVLYDTINDTRYTVVLSCNAAKPQCLKTRKAPGSGKQQVPAAYYNIDENVVNLCDAFFGMPQVEDLECKAETPMSYYSGMSSGLLHEIIHAIFEPLSKTNYDFITFELAYGFGSCVELAQGTCRGTENDLRCSPLGTIANVDTIVWLAYGYHWYNRCSQEGKTIPLY